MSDNRNTRVMLNNVRLAFAHIFEPQPSMDPGGKPKYNCTMIFEPGSANEKKMKKAMTEAAKAKWGSKAHQIHEALLKKDRTCLRDGADKAKYDGFEDMVYVSASTDVRPTVVDTDRSPLTSADGRPYPGCYANVSVDVWAQDNSFGQRINAQLRGVQFYADGPAFGAGRPAAADEFDDISGSDDDASWGDGDGDGDGDDTDDLF